MPKKSKSTVDDIRKELRMIRRERRRDKIFTKLDSLFFVLVTLATFFSGILINQYHTLIKFEITFLLIGLLITLLVTFVIGFKGIVNDDLDTRLWSWATLFNSFVWLVSGLVVVSVRPTGYRLLILGIPILPLLIGMITGAIQTTLLKGFMGWTESNLSSLLNERVKASAKVYTRAILTTLGIWTISVSLGYIIEWLYSL